MTLVPSTFFIYTRKYKHPFPRGGLRLYPIVARKGEASMFKNESEIIQFTSLEKDVFVNLFSEDQKQSKFYDCIFLDIDSKDLQNSFIMLLKCISRLVDNGIKYYHVMFSGSKGFHIYIPFEDTFLSNYRVAVIGFLKNIDIVDYVDTSAIEPNRVTRIPNSINAKSGLRCYYLGDNTNESEWFLPTILEHAKVEYIDDVKYVTNILKNNIPDLKKFDRESRDRVKNPNKEFVKGVKSNMFRKPIHYPECMQILFDEAMSGTDLGHSERLELGKFMLHVTGYNVELVKTLFAKMSDYNESKTDYNLQYIMRRDLRMLGCEKMIQEGICPFSNKLEAERECPFYPSINRFISIERRKQRDDIK